MSSTNDDPSCTDQLKAKQVFDALDADKNGHLDSNEVKGLL
jgi:Ca2+-binding EF-hand superfamily protein